MKRVLLDGDCSRRRIHSANCALQVSRGHLLAGMPPPGQATLLDVEDISTTKLLDVKESLVLRGLASLCNLQPHFSWFRMFCRAEADMMIFCACRL